VKDLQTLESEENTTLQIMWNRSPSNTASYSRRKDFRFTTLLKHQNSDLKLFQHANREGKKKDLEHNEDECLKAINTVV
jgi:hypothetical protein